MHSLPHHLSAKVASGPGLQCVIWVCIGIGRFRWAPIPQTAPSVPSSLDWSRHLINPLLMTLIIMDLGSIACKQDTDLPFGPFALLSMLPALKGNEASILAALNLPVFVPTLPPPLPSKTPTPKANFKVRTRIRFWSSQVLHPTSRRPQFTPSSHHPGGLTWYLSYPYHHHRLSIPRRSLPHPQIKLDSQGGTRAASRSGYFSATASRSSSQRGGWWNNQDPNLRVVTQTLSKEEGEVFWICSLKTACLDKGGWKIRWFSVVSSCKVEYVLIVISHFEKFNHWRVTRI